MGFEQLAGLKKQLAKQAEQAKAKQVEQSKAEQTKAKKPPRARRAAPAPAPAPAVPSKPVDPVVHTIGKLQKRFPLAFPKNPAPKVPL